MTATPDEVPSYRLYTSEQAAERAGGDLTKATFDRWARSGEVEYTDPGRRILWTDAQIAAAVAHFATRPGEVAKASPGARSASTRRSGPTAGTRSRHDIAPLESRPGCRYAAASS
jgi:hypothetical protein